MCVVNATLLAAVIAVVDFNLFSCNYRQSYNISITSDTDDLKDQVISCRDFVLPPSPYSSTMDIEIGGKILSNILGSTCILY